MNLEKENIDQKSKNHHMGCFWNTPQNTTDFAYSTAL